MKRFVVILALLVSFKNSYSQNIYTPIDTLETSSGTMLIYPDRSWEYLSEVTFDGILNPELNNFVTTDSNFLYKSYWKNNVVITCNSNEVKTMKDTLWMCVVDSLHTNYSIPVNGIVTSRFGIRHGRNHNGIDLDLETGDTVYAAFDGKIRYSQVHSGGFGKLVIVRHYNGLETYYAHLSQLMVAPNQYVKAGQAIGLGGNTGRSTGSHLHFEVRFYDKPINPELIFDFKQKLVKDENLFVHKAIFSNSGSGHSTYSKGDKKYHRIRSGDTLGAIARRNHTSVSKLCRLNGIRATTTLHIGKSLRVR